MKFCLSFRSTVLNGPGRSISINISTESYGKEDAISCLVERWISWVVQGEEAIKIIRICYFLPSVRNWETCVRVVGHRQNLMILVCCCWEARTSPNEFQIERALFVIEALHNIPEDLNAIVCHRAILYHWLNQNNLLRI